MKTYPTLFYGIIVDHMSCLVHGLHGDRCLFQGWDISTLGNTLSGCVTQDPSVGPSEACAIIHPTHPVHLVVCTTEAYCCACRLVHKWINEGLRSPQANPKSVTSKCMGCVNVSWKLLAAVAVMQLYIQGWWCWVCVWKLSYTRVFTKKKLLGFVTQFCSPSNMFVCSIDTRVHAQSSLSIFTTLSTVARKRERACINSTSSDWESLRTEVCPHHII